jgi:hypothetical protein
MKTFFAFLLDLGRNRICPVRDTFHDDTLRANQGDRSGPTFSFWRALVS